MRENEPAKLDDWQKMPSSLITPNVQLWSQSGVMLGLRDLHCARSLVAQGSHFVISEQAIGGVHAMKCPDCGCDNEEDETSQYKPHATLDEAIALDAAEYVCLLVTRAKSMNAPFPLQAIEELFLEAMQKSRKIGHLPMTGIKEEVK